MDEIQPEEPRVTTDQHITALTALPVDDRLEIVLAILDTLPPTAVPAPPVGWKEELDARVARYEANPDSAMTLEQFRTRQRKQSS